MIDDALAVMTKYGRYVPDTEQPEPSVDARSKPGARRRNTGHACSVIDPSSTARRVTPSSEPELSLETREPSSRAVSARLAAP
jgi:hypothetical protein